MNLSIRIGFRILSLIKDKYDEEFSAIFSIIDFLILIYSVLAYCLFILCSPSYFWVLI